MLRLRRLTLNNLYTAIPAVAAAGAVPVTADGIVPVPATADWIVPVTAAAAAATAAVAIAAAVTAATAPGQRGATWRENQIRIRSSRIQSSDQSHAVHYF